MTTRLDQRAPVREFATAQRLPAVEAALVGARLPESVAVASTS